jgi:hypothetical protein
LLFGSIKNGNIPKRGIGKDFQQMLAGERVKARLAGHL